MCPRAEPTTNSSPPRLNRRTCVPSTRSLSTGVSARDSEILLAASGFSQMTRVYPSPSSFRLDKLACRLNRRWYVFKRSGKSVPSLDLRGSLLEMRQHPLFGLRPQVTQRCLEALRLQVQEVRRKARA